MYPYLQIGQRAVSSYHLCLILAFTVGALLLARTPPRGFSSDKLHIQFTVIIPVFLLALFGAKILSLVLDGGDWSFSNLLPWRGGYYYHGGLIGGITGYVLYLRWTGNRVLDGLDWVSPFAALGEAIARIGCFLAGCCYGKVTYAITAVVYPAHSLVWNKHATSGLIDDSALVSLPVHPAPVYTSFSMIVLFLLLRMLQQHRHFAGEISLHYLTWHSFCRVVIEYFRDDMPQLSTGWTYTQTGAAAIFVISFSLLAWQYARPVKCAALQLTEEKL